MLSITKHLLKPFYFISIFHEHVVARTVNLPANVNANSIREMQQPLRLGSCRVMRKMIELGGD